jgi:hypothetical protein
VLVYYWHNWCSSAHNLPNAALRVVYHSSQAIVYKEDVVYHQG